MKRGLIIGLFFIMLISSVSAYTISQANLQSGLDSISISSASNAYSYEVNFTISGGSVSNVAFDGFLSVDGATTSTGYTTKGSNLYVYESRLVSPPTGITNSTRLFNVSYSGTLTLTGAVVVNTAGTAEHVSYLSSSTTSSSSTSSGGSSSSGSGASIAKTNVSGVSIRIVPDIYTATSVYGVGSTDEITIVNDGDKAETLEISVDGGVADFITFTNGINIDAHSEKKLKLIINGLRGGIVTGRMIFSVSRQKVAEMPIVLNVRSENFLFDSAISVLEKFRSLKAGQPLKAQITLLQVGKPEKVDVTANYEIQDFSGNKFAEESETFFVLNEKSFAKDFATNGLPPGKYIVGMEILYPGAFATSSSQFEIVEGGLFSPTILIISGFVVIVLIIIIFFFVWERRRKKRLYSHIRRRR